MNRVLRITPLLPIAFSISALVLFNLTWWLARANSWQYAWEFNRYNEAIIEGILFHVALVVNLVWVIQWARSR